MGSVGLDIGGANLKASDTRRTVSQPFALWKNPSGLAGALKTLLAEFPYANVLGVTMTGELADCYANRCHGVREIVQAVTLAASGRPVHYWQTGGEFVDAETACEFWQLTAAANWHALATWAGRACPQGTSLLIDIGSTTTDIIPLSDGLPATRGLTDRERLSAGELVYAGASRTPVAMLVDALELDGEGIPVARELFATTLDTGLLTGRLSDDVLNCDTADGQPATIPHAQQRIARLFCADADEFTQTELASFAHQIEDRLRERIASGIRQVLEHMNCSPALVLTSGSGEPLAKLVVEAFPELRAVERISLKQLLGEDHSRGACAYAVAELLAQHNLA